MHNSTLAQWVNHVDSERILGNIEGSNNGPTVILFCGIHGNESAGVKATKSILHHIQMHNIKFKGNLIAIQGNIKALYKKVRFIDVDLNRIWKKENIDSYYNETIEINAEVREQIEILNLIKAVLKYKTGPFYFIDLHTTSSESVPFITISDSLNNRKFSENFPLPVVLGIEEFLDGPLLTFINEYGHVALGFEGGQHNAKSSEINCEAFVWKSLVYAKCVKKNDIPDYYKYIKQLSNLCCRFEFFEIIYRYALQPGEKFEMVKGFKNFEEIKKDQLLAFSNGKEIKAIDSGRIFMPLYQKQGEDGFFILRKISKFWLNLSIVVRRLKINHFLRLIPGVNKDSDNNYTLIVNLKIARFLAKEIFHLFGYRKQIYKDNKLHFIKRDRKISELE